MVFPWLQSPCRAWHGCQGLGVLEWMWQGMPRVGGLDTLPGTGQYHWESLGIMCTGVYTAFTYTCCIAGDGALLAHATFRVPNLKARMASARQEFRAQWRGLAQSDFGHDYTL